MTEADISAVLQAIEMRYGSLSEPNFFFVRKAVAAQPYAGLVSRLSRTFSIEETTDVTTT